MGAVISFDHFYLFAAVKLYYTDKRRKSWIGEDIASAFNLHCAPLGKIVKVSYFPILFGVCGAGGQCG